MTPPPPSRSRLQACTHPGVIHVPHIKVTCGVQLWLLRPCHLLAAAGVNTPQHCIAIVGVHLCTRPPTIKPIRPSSIACCRAGPEAAEPAAAAAVELLPRCICFEPFTDVAVRLATF
jgi:hypothetical protein